MAQVEPVDPFDGREQNLRFSLTMYWDTNTLEWVKGTQGSGGGGGGGTEYTQDAAAPANPVGGVRQVVRVDTPSAVGADGDIVTQKGTAYGAAYVTLLDSSGATPTIGGGVQYAQGDTDASITGTAMLMEGAGDTLLTVPGSTADGILVNLGANNDVTVAAIPALGQAAMASSLPVVMASNQTPVPTGSQIAAPTASFTRPSDTTAYTIGDVVCNSTSSPTILTFTGMARANGGSGVIVGASLVLGSNPTTKPTYDLFLFDTSVTIDNDNSAFTPTDAEMLKCVAVISLSVPTVGDASGTTTNCVYFAIPMASYVCDASATALYGVLVSRNAVTPTSADTYNLRLVASLN